MAKRKSNESKIKKPKKERRMEVINKKYKPMPIETFRKEWLKKGYELVDITRLCTFKLGYSGWCNSWNSPDEEIYHLQVFYRDEEIGILNGLNHINWNENYIVFEDTFDKEDFIIFKKCKVCKCEEKSKTNGK